jgi:hypothetical protein
MSWDVQASDEYLVWWETLALDIQESILTVAELLEQKGPTLPHPYSSGIHDSRHSHMRELRIQHKGSPFRVLYAFDPVRSAILLIGGDKTGDDKRWYKEYVPKADDIYDAHISMLRKKGEIK